MGGHNRSIIGANWHPTGMDDQQAAIDQLDYWILSALSIQAIYWSVLCI
jgi:hypothetical protein